MFSKSKAVLYLHKNGISYYVDKDSSGLQMEYGEAVEGLLVKSPEKLQAQVATFLKENFPDTYKTIVLLSEEIVLEKSILTKSPDEQRIEIQRFLDDVPFKNYSRLLYKMSGILQVIATNRDLYESVVNILTQYGWEVEAVVPIRIFGQVTTNNILSGEDIKEIIKKKDLLKEGNLLTDSTPAPLASRPVEKEEPVKVDNQTEEPFVSPGFGPPPSYKTESSPFSFKSILFGLLVALIFFGIGFAILQSNIWKKVPGLTSFTATPTLSPSPTPTSTPTPEPVAKKDLKISVLNGTGKVGQAGVVKSALANLGYTNITTDNASSTDHTDTTVAFASGVSKADKDAIKKSLEDSFKTVTVSFTPPSSGDVEITTGTQK